MQGDLTDSSLIASRLFDEPSSVIALSDNELQRFVCDADDMNGMPTRFLSVCNSTDENLNTWMERGQELCKQEFGMAGADNLQMGRLAAAPLMKLNNCGHDGEFIRNQKHDYDCC